MPEYCHTLTRQIESKLTGAEIKRRREAIGLSQIGLAFKASVHLRTIERIEEGRIASPRQTTLKCIEDALASEAAAA